VFPSNENFVPGFFWGPGGYNTLWHQAPWENHEELFIWKDDFSKVVGAHDLKFGALYSRNKKDEQGNGASGSNTPLAILGCGSHTGNCIADTLLKDLPVAEYAENDHTPVSLGRWHDLEFYANDTWKIRPRVTLTLGLRYSYFPQTYTADNRISNFIPSLYDGKNFQSALITADQASQFGLQRSLTKAYRAGFQPRVGIAWDIFGDGKTALRLGFGRYLSRSNVIEDINRMVANPPWVTSVDTSTFGSGERVTLAECPTCRSLDTINPGLKNAVVAFNPLSNTLAAVDIHFKPPESYQWNLTISREIMKDTVLELSYIGNEGHHIWRRNVDKNDIPPGPARLLIANAVRLGLPATELINNNRPLKGIGTVQTSESTGNSNYNALQVWLNRRFTNNLAFQAAYTWGHALSDVPLTAFTNATSDPYNYHLDYGDADLDRRHTFVGNVVYALPSFEKMGSFASAILGGWQVNGIFSYYSTLPVASGAQELVTNVNTLGVASSVGQRPNLVPGQPIYLHTSDKTQWLNPAAFSLPDPGTIGNVTRGLVRGTPITTVDASLNKNFRFGERYMIQFRAEAFNLFNHPNFVGYSANLNFQGNITQANFGTITNGGFGLYNAVQNHREIQFGLKFSF
jgi:hypothetical protein